MTLALPARIRLRFVKVGRVRFTSQRDLARIMERALRRASMPLARTAGFSPRPQLAFGLALPTGCASLAEYLDLRLDPTAESGAVAVVEPHEVAPETMSALAVLLSDKLPDGVEVTAAGTLHGPEPSLQEAVASCDWELEVLGVSPAVLAGRVARLLAADVVPIARERKGRVTTDDLRPTILDLEVDGVATDRGATRLRASLSTRHRGVRPAELCAALGADVTPLGVCRTHQWIENDDRTLRAEPLSESGTVCVGLPAGTEVRGG
jgi:radical SAM-linked protein